MKSETITEYFAIGKETNVKDNVIKNVKVLGKSSKNNRIYEKEAIEKGAELYEGIRVNINHPEGQADSPRDYRDRFGYLESIKVVDGEIFGDLIINPKHELAEQFIWDAENAPKNTGLSHNVTARVDIGRNGKPSIIKEITKVISVDIVSNPATADSLYEEAEPSKEDQEEIEKEAEEEAEREAEDKLESEAESKLPNKVESTSESIFKKIKKIDKELQESNLPQGAIDLSLIEELYYCKTEEERSLKMQKVMNFARKIKEETLAEIEGNKPTSKPSGSWKKKESQNLKNFATSITKGY